MQARDVEERLDRIERTLQEVQAEVDEIRASVTAAAAVPEAPPTPVVPQPAPVAPQPAPVATPTIAAAWRALERGRDREAVEQAEGVLARALAVGDGDEVRAVADFADAGAMHVADPELAVRLAALARYAGHVLHHLEQDRLQRRPRAPPPGPWLGRSRRPRPRHPRPRLRPCSRARRPASPHGPAAS